jgi:hypothetical protein
MLCTLQTIADLIEFDLLLLICPPQVRLCYPLICLFVHYLWVVMSAGFQTEIEAPGKGPWWGAELCMSVIGGWGGRDFEDTTGLSGE